MLNDDRGRHTGPARERFQPWVWGVFGVLAGLAPTAAGLSLGGQRFTATTIPWTIAAALVPGVIAFLGARSNRKLVEEQRAQLGFSQQLIAERQQLAEEFKDLVEDARADRSSTAGSLALLGTSFAELLTTYPDDVMHRLGNFETQLVEVLGTTLEGVQGQMKALFLEPVRAVLLEAVGKPDVLLEKRIVSWGHQRAVSWRIHDSGPDANVAKAIIEGREPYEQGYLVENIDKARQKGERLYLEPPDPDVQSYCRVAVVPRKGLRPALLCVDTWSKRTPFSASDLEVVRSFAQMLAVALSAAESRASE
jgi:hypothetical protein